MIDLLYMCLMPSVGFIVGTCTTCALYEAVIMQQRHVRLRDALATRTRQIESARRHILLANSQIKALSQRVKQAAQRRDGKGRFAK